MELLLGAYFLTQIGQAVLAVGVGVATWYITRQNRRQSKDLGEIHLLVNSRLQAALDTIKLLRQEKEEREKNGKAT